MYLTTNPKLIPLLEALAASDDWREKNLQEGISLFDHPDFWEGDSSSSDEATNIGALIWMQTKTDIILQAGITKAAHQFTQIPN